MKQVLIRKGAAHATEVPAPSIEAGKVLVQVKVSCLSVGTEMSGISSSAVPMWKKALKQPEKLTSTLKMAQGIGVRHTLDFIKEKKDASYPTGYSATGIVIGVGKVVSDIHIGDRVACAGAQSAFHAEVISVPRNLCVPVPENLDWESASTVTLGAIALQGVRRACPTIGETFVVIGLGILGQLTIQLLKANGCRTIGVDLDRDRIKLAQQLGMNVGFHPGDSDEKEQVARLTDGLGADGVIITAATPSNDVVSTAFNMCRKKGRVVLVGDVGLNLNRSDFYKKEIDFFISTSYGPGRYDRRYEEQGLDYPAAYVRWTENRNMSEYLRLLDEQNINIKPLVSARYSISDATNAYESLISTTKKPLMVLLTYPPTKTHIERTVVVSPNTTIKPGVIRVALIGAGGFARSMHLPNLKGLHRKFKLHAVVSGKGHNAIAVANQYGANYASTDYQKVLADPDIDAVIITTRHNLHANMVMSSLQAGKHVFVEKPLVLTPDELNELDSYIINAKNSNHSLPVLLTGYNRRFSPYAQRMVELLQNRSAPFMLNYRMNAGYIPQDHWVHGPEGGGRNLGEACHIYDLFSYLSNTKVTKVSVNAIVPKTHYYGRTDNFIATLTFDDGSVCSLTYTALGHKDYPKETAELYTDGELAIMTDYKKLDVFGARGKTFKTSIKEKGHKNELISFANAINNGEWPIPWWQQMQVSEVAFAVEEMIFEHWHK